MAESSSWFLWINIRCVFPNFFVTVVVAWDRFALFFDVIEFRSLHHTTYIMTICNGWLYSINKFCWMLKYLRVSCLLFQINAYLCRIIKKENQLTKISRYKQVGWYWYTEHTCTHADMLAYIYVCIHTDPQIHIYLLAITTCLPKIILDICMFLCLDT